MREQLGARDWLSVALWLALLAELRLLAALLLAALSPGAADCARWIWLARSLARSKLLGHHRRCGASRARLARDARSIVPAAALRIPQRRALRRATSRASVHGCYRVVRGFCEQSRVRVRAGLRRGAI